MKLEKTLVEMVCHFTPARASDWLRILFSSFETDLEPIAVDTTKNESAYFAEARRLGWVTHLPETDSAEAANKPLVVVAVRMKGDLTERTSRLVQFAFAKKVIQNAIARGGRGIHGLPTQGLFFFYDKDGYFRISLVHGEAEGRKLKYNSAKRQSFYVDPTAANNILRRRLGDTIKTFAELKNAFSVEQLTKEFYGRLFEWYTWALAPRTGVTFPNDLADEKDDRKYNHEAIIRLITRLMFTWFIRQKIPALKELFERDSLDGILKGNRGKGKFNPDSMEDDNYYRCILQNLFFATFNCPQSGKDKLLRRWINADVDERGDGRGLSDDYNVTTVYRYRNEFKNPDAFLENMRSVPFLNCALFDCLDKAERKQDGGRKLYFDGFSTKIKRQAHVPNGLFFKEGCGLIDLFNGYEFTIDENSADDADVALDPELLGKVFENLLGAFNPETQETARKATGSFYTPREIVDYMVEESLKNYLKGRLPDTTKDIDHKLDDLFDRTKAAEGSPTQFSAKDTETLLNALYDCKVLDPACGSGAFPMGVLHCMVRLLARLDPDSISIRERLIARYRADKDSVDPAETASDRRERLAELEKCLDEGQHYPDYARKLYLIENCIYGVDIQPIATQISKLRFFISLLCDQFRTSFNGDDANYGLLALPNLEAKFVCANTLISLPETSGELDLTASGVMEARERLKINRHRIFGARSTGTKEKYKKRDLEIRDEIREAVINGLAKPDESVIEACERQIKAAQSRRAKVAEPKWEERVVQVQMDLFSPVEARTERIDVNRQEREKIDSEIAWAEKRINDERAKAERSNVSAAQNYAALVAGWDPFDQNASSEFFDPEWMFNVTDGFDVVIGNPPYIQLQANGGELADIYESRGFKTFSRTGDIYCLFYEKGYEALSQNGILCFITSDKWMCCGYGEKLRQFVLKSTTPILLVDFTGQQIFDTATVEVNVLIVKREGQRHVDVTTLSIHACVIQHETEGLIKEQVALHGVNAPFTCSEFWVIRSQPEITLFEKLRNVGRPLRDWNVRVYFGVKTGLDEAFLINAETRARLISADSSSRRLIKPIFRGKDIGKYCPANNQMWLIATFPARNLDINDFPAIKKHLLSFGRDVLEQSGQKNVGGVKGRNARKRTSNMWFETQDQISFYREFSREKVMWKRIGSDLRFCYSCGEVYGKDTTCMMTGEHIKYLTAFLNSRMGHYLLKNSPRTGTGDLLISVQAIEPLRVPFPSSEVERVIASKIDAIIAAKKKDSNADTSALESEIDQLVYKLYGLTDDEIAIVEGRDESKQEPQGETARRPAASPRRHIQSPAPTASDSTDDEVLE